jgi:hypothetical protein
MLYKLSVQHSNSYPLALSTQVFSPPTQTYFSVIQNSLFKLLVFLRGILRERLPSTPFSLAEAHLPLFSGQAFDSQNLIEFGTAPILKLGVQDCS